MLSQLRLKWYKKLYLFLVPNPREQLINIDFNESYFTVGRNTELTNLNQNINRNINTLNWLHRFGKSHLLKTSQRIKKYCDWTIRTISKKSLRKFYFPFQRKETVLAMLWKDFTTDEINKKIQRET
jgi:hypothetical protein